MLRLIIILWFTADRVNHRNEIIGIEFAAISYLLIPAVGYY